MTHAPRKEDQASVSDETAPIPGPVVGWIAGAGADGTVLVDFEGNAGGPLPARSTVALDGDAVLSALGSRQGAVLLFERGDPARPLIIGLVQPGPERPMLELMLPASTTGSTEEGAPKVAAVATVDGERVSIEGRDEIVLRCGEASITLRRNGKVIIRGAYVETYAAGTNRIKGGSVRIN
jgi:hypothetical protein